ISDAVLIAHAAHVFKQRKLISSSVKQLNARQRRAVLIAARISQKKLQVRLGKQRKIVILSGVFGIEQMLAGAAICSEARIKIVVQTPGQVVSIQAVFLNAKRRALIWVVAQALRGEHRFIEIFAVSIAGVDA